MTPDDIILRKEQLLRAGWRLRKRSQRLQERLEEQPTPELTEALARVRVDYAKRVMLIQAHMAGLIGLERRGEVVLH